MKKNTKGAIALGAAALLLAGGAGTYAAWSDSETLAGGSVTSGELRITQASGGVWTWAGGDEFNPDEDLIVPGDEIEYTAEYTLAVTGTNLVAALDASVSDDLTGDLAPYLTASATSDTVGIDLDNITDADDGKTVSVTVTIEFDPETSGQDGMEASASLADSTITLEQTAPASNTP